MNSAFRIAEGYFLLPLGIAVLMYVLVHFQLLLLNKVLDLGLTHQKRTRMNVMAFFASFFIVLALVLVKGFAG